MGDLKLPMNVNENNMGNKKCDYKILAIMTLYSNKKPIKDGDDEEECYRFLYRNKVIEMSSDIEKLSKNKINTILKNIKKLSDLSGNLVNAMKTSDGKIVYTINYKDGDIEVDDDGNVIKFEKGSYVIVEEDILKFLVNVGNSDTIKVYLIIRALCEWNKKINNKYEVMMTREWICTHIGLSAKSRSNLQTISDITYMLECTNLITKRLVRGNIEGRYKTKVYYGVVPYNEFKKSKGKKIS